MQQSGGCGPLSTPIRENHDPAEVLKQGLTPVRNTQGCGLTRYQRPGKLGCVVFLRVVGGFFRRVAHPDRSTPSSMCWFQTAMTVARGQRAKFFELRAATDLARIWAAEGRRDDARRLVQQTCSWFDDVTSSADFTHANELLAELA